MGFGERAEDTGLLTPARIPMPFANKQSVARLIYPDNRV